MKMALKMCAVHLPLLTKPKPWYLSCEHNTFPQHNCTFHWLILYRTTTICYLSTKRGGAIWYRAMTMAVFGMEYLLTTYCVVYYLYTMEACFHHRIIKKKKKNISLHFISQFIFACNSEVISKWWLSFSQNCERYICQCC